jgi:hypothetical protein
MKRYNIDAPCNNQYEEHPEGEWVSYEDAKAALDALSKKLATVQSNAIDQELENDEAHAAELDGVLDLLRRVGADWNRPNEWARDVANYLEKIGAKP